MLASRPVHITYNVHKFHNTVKTYREIRVLCCKLQVILWRIRHYWGFHYTFTSRFTNKTQVPRQPISQSACSQLIPHSKQVSLSTDSVHLWAYIQGLADARNLSRTNKPPTYANLSSRMKLPHERCRNLTGER